MTMRGCAASRARASRRRRDGSARRATAPAGTLEPQPVAAESRVQRGERMLRRRDRLREQPHELAPARPRDRRPRCRRRVGRAEAVDALAVEQHELPRRDRRMSASASRRAHGCERVAVARARGELEACRRRAARDPCSASARAGASASRPRRAPRARRVAPRASAPARARLRRRSAVSPCAHAGAPAWTQS